MVRKLPITYNAKKPLGAVYANPHLFLIYQKFFEDFLFVTDGKQKWLDDNNIPYHSLNIGTARPSNDKMFRSKKFIEFAKQNSRRKFILYEPLDPPYKFNPLSLLMNSPTIAHAYENKRYFRDEFSDLIRMPEYTIKHVDELDKAAAYKDLKEEFGKFVLQDEESSGSKGTFIVKNQADYMSAIAALKRISYGRSIVVSKFINGQITSLQVCITKYGIFNTGVQKQLLSSAELCNPKMEGVAKWCGGELGGNYPDIVQHQAREMATIVGSELASHGYKGVFGIDLIVTPENEVYAIEINARLTGYSFLISDMQLKQGKIPFMLLHALELGNIDYEVTDLDALPSTSRYKRPVSYLIAHNPNKEPVTLKKEIKPGLYKVTNKEIKFVKEAFSVEQLQGDDDTILIFSRYNQGDQIGSGKRILQIIKIGRSMGKKEVTTKTAELISKVKKHFSLP